MRWYISACSSGASGISLVPWDLNRLCHQRTKGRRTASTRRRRRAEKVHGVSPFYLQVETGRVRFVHDDVSVSEGGELKQGE